MADSQVAHRPAYLLEPRGPGPMSGDIVKRVIVQAGAYDGQQHDGYRHGQGCYMWSNGQKYDGEWRNDMRNGQGTETWPDGRRYHGEWRNDQFHGRGVWTWADGKVFQGVFQNYCPLDGELFMPDGTMFHVRFDGECPVFDGTCPVALLQKKELDAELAQVRRAGDVPCATLTQRAGEKVVLVRQEEMYQMLCTHRVLSQMLRERWIKGDDMELAQGEHVLRIDEVFLRAQEEVRRSVEIRRSVDSARCVSLEAKRKRGALTQAMEGAPGATDPHASGELVPGRQSSVPTTRVSIELEHRPVGGFEREREGPHGAMSEDEEEEEVDQQGHVVSKQRWHKETLSSTGSGVLMEEARRISLEVRSRVSQEMKRMSQEVRRQIGRPGDNARQGEEQKLLSSFSKNDACDLSTIPDSPHAAPSPAVKPAPLVA